MARESNKKKIETKTHFLSGYFEANSLFFVSCFGEMNKTKQKKNKFAHKLQYNIQLHIFVSDLLKNFDMAKETE